MAIPGAKIGLFNQAHHLALRARQRNRFIARIQLRTEIVGLLRQRYDQGFYLLYFDRLCLQSCRLRIGLAGIIQRPSAGKQRIQNQRQRQPAGSKALPADFMPHPADNGNHQQQRNADQQSKFCQRYGNQPRNAGNHLRPKLINPSGIDFFYQRLMPRRNPDQNKENKSKGKSDGCPNPGILFLH